MENQRRILRISGPLPSEISTHGSSQQHFWNNKLHPREAWRMVYLGIFCHQRFEQTQVPLPTKWGILARFFVLLIFSSCLVVSADVDGSELERAWHSYGDVTLMLDSTSDLQQRQQLEQEIQQAAFAAFDHHKTGRLYNVSITGVPSASIIQAMRLRSGSLRKRGLVLNEFLLPPGCEVESFPERVLLVYENFGDSPSFLGLQGYELVGSVVGLFAYDASDLTTILPIPKLNVNATRSPISVQIPLFSSFRDLTPLCAFFDDNGDNVSLSRLVSPPSTCITTHLGLYTLVIRTPAPVPSPLPSPSRSPSPSIVSSPISGTSNGGNSNVWKVAVGPVVGAVGLLAVLSILASATVRYKRKQRFTFMEYQADQGETLQTALIRNSRAPTAAGTRTQPMLESEYAV